MRLRALFRQLDPNAISDVNALISSFEQAGIKTVPDFLYSLPPAVLYDRLPPGTIPYANFLSLQRQTAQLTAATPLTGNELLEEQKIKRAGMAGGSLGVEQLDSLLGGLGLLHVVEVVGGHSSGKTARDPLPTILNVI